MELKEFVKKVILDLDQAVTEANTETSREIRFKGVKESRTALEFDVAVTVESKEGANGGAGIKVWGLGEVGAKASAESKNSTISRVSFGVDIAERTKAEMEESRKKTRTQFKKNNPNNYR